MANLRRHNNLRKHKKTLLILAKSRPKLIRKIILSADRSLINTLSECALNVLKGVVPLTKSKKKKLARFKRNLRLLARKNGSIKAKKKALQTGGFLSLLAGAIAPLLIQGIGKGVGKLVSIIRRKKKKRH